MDHLDFTNIANFAILVNHSHDVLLDHISVENSGSRNARGRNNTSGGILLEQGTDAFTVADSVFRNIRGNAVWTHSYNESPRNHGGKIANNKFFDIGRDAIQVGHATEVVVMGNTGSRIGFPIDLVDVEGGGIPVGIDTAGNVEHSSYEDNHFEEINGKCIDLDGFHDGACAANTCINRGKPEDYPFGNFGIVFNNANAGMRSQNIIMENKRARRHEVRWHLRVRSGPPDHPQPHADISIPRIATRHRAKFGCSAIAGEPEVLESGIYLGSHAEHPGPARNN